MSDSIHLRWAEPGARVADLDASLAFYALFGFEPVYRNEDLHAVIRRDDVTLHLSTKEGGQGNCQIVVTGVDALLAHAREAGIEPRYEPGDRPWGVRDFTVADPDGNLITFAEPLGGVGDAAGTGSGAAAPRA